MIYPTETEQALYDMTQERNALAAECERLVDAIAQERGANVERIARLEREGRELLAMYEGVLVLAAKLEREAEATRRLMVDALTAVVPAHAGGLT